MYQRFISNNVEDKITAMVEEIEAGQHEIKIDHKSIL